MKCLTVEAGIAVVVEGVEDAVVETAAAIAEEGATIVEVHLVTTEVLVVVEIVPEAENDVADLLAGNLRFS